MRRSSNLKLIILRIRLRFKDSLAWESYHGYGYHHDFVTLPSERHKMKLKV